MCPDSSLSLRKPPPLPSLPCIWASGPKTAYSQFNTRVLQKQITQPCRLIQRNSHGICPQIASHHHIMCTDIYKLVPTRVHTHVHFHPMDTDACAHRSCADTKPHIHVHMFIHTQPTYMFISHHLSTHICSMSYTKSSPNKNFIHCSQIQY